MEMSKRQTEVFAINDEKWNPTHFSNISNKYWDISYTWIWGGLSAFSFL